MYTIIHVFILSILTHIKFRYIQLYLYLYFDILTIIRVIIQSYQLCDTYNYMGNYIWVYLQLYEWIFE